MPKKKPPKKKLTKKEELFLHYYLQDFNASRAASKAGYTGNYPAEAGYAILSKAHIKAKVKKVVDRLIEKSEDKIAAIIKQLFIRTTYNPDDIIDDEGDFVVPLSELGDLAYCIDGIETKLNAKGDKYRIIKLANRERNLEMLGKYMQILTDKVEHSGSISLDIGEPPTPSSMDTKAKTTTKRKQQ